MFGRANHYQNSLWEVSATAAVSTDTLRDTLTADVLVIGGGYTGLSAALYLSERGASTVLLEAADFGTGESRRSAGLVNAGAWLLPEQIEAALGEAAGRRVNDAIGSAPEIVFSLIEKHGIECEAKRAGTLHVAHTERMQALIRDRFTSISSHRRAVQLVGGSDVAVMTGSRAYQYLGLFDPGAGTVQPLSYVRGLARAAIHQGARLFQRSRAVSLCRSAHGWTAKTAEGEVTADHVIVATNAYTDMILPGVAQSFVPISMFQVATDPLPPRVAESILPTRVGVVDTRKVLLSSRIDDAGRLIMCSTGGTTGDERSLRPSWAGRARDRLFPQAKSATWKYYWSGSVGFTDNHLPRAFEPEPGLMIPVGYNGRGIGLGTIVGRECATLALTGDRSRFPLPIQSIRKVKWRSAKTAYYEFATRAYNLVNRS